ncbi:type IV pilin (plasmid) [Haloferax sp. S1W]|uniref:type IV pilin n=1 Tax=Haloferax sp. S1W TaxID=3377110 RepID=UPI0037C50B95
MTVSQFLTDDDAVSSVLGVVILIVISLTLAAIIGVFVFNSSDEISDEKPDASFEFEFEDDASTPRLTIRHDSGAPVPADQLTVTVDGTNVSLSPGYDYEQSFSGTVETGTTAVVTKESAGPAWDGEAVRVVWTSNAGSETAVLEETTAPTTSATGED